MIRLVGFDIRRSPETATPWDEARRDRFLLKSEVVRPLSVDQSVWPSLLPEEVESREWHGVLGHWSDLAALIARARATGIHESESRLVATFLPWDLLVAAERERLAATSLERTDPESLGPDWRVVGYDIADQWLVSGLANCAYTADERAVWHARWAECLNAFHLFNEREDALSFARETDKRVRDHAPFYVYGLAVRNSFE